MQEFFTMNDSIEIRLTESGKRFIVNLIKEDLINQECYCKLGMLPLYSHWLNNDWNQVQMHVLVDTFKTARSYVGNSLPFEWRPIKMKGE